MKKTLIGLSLVAFAAGGVAIAQPMGGPARDPMGGKTVTRAEAQTRAGEMFAKMDANKDGKLDAADREARRGAMFSRLDTDKNGAISRDEFNARHQRAQGAREGMKGEGHKGEGHRGHGMRGTHGKKGMGGMMMMRMADTNKDGAVSRDELLAAHAKHFDMADANKDGSLTPEERKAAHAKMREHKRGMKGGHEGS